MSRNLTKEQISILFKQFMDWENEEGMRFTLNNARPRYFFDYQFFFEENARVLEESQKTEKQYQLKNLNDAFITQEGIDNLKKLLCSDINYDKNKKKIDRNSMDAFKNYFADILKYFYSKTPSQKIEMFIHLMKNGHESAKGHLFEIFANTLPLDAKKEVFNKMIEIPQNKEWLDRIIRFPYFQDFIEKSFIPLYKVNGDLLSEYYTPQINSKIAPFIKKEFNVFWTGLSQQGKEQQNFFNIVLSSGQKNNFEFLRKVVEFNPDLDMTHATFKNIFHLKNVEKDNKKELMEVLKIDVKKISYDSLLLLKKGDVKMMQYMIENDAPVNQDVLNIDFSKIPKDRHQFVKTKKVMDVWMQRVGVGAEKSILEKAYIKSVTANSTRSKMKVL